MKQIHLAFAGNRQLFPTDWDSIRKENAWTELALALQKILQELRVKLRLSSDVAFVGISQIAIGADSLFADACAALQLPHRIFLPQALDAYLHAIGSQGPDFTASEIKAAEQRLARPNMIGVEVVSQSPDRRTRFSECMSALAQAGDVLITLERHDQRSSKQGGTHEFVPLAQQLSKPILAIELYLESNCRLIANWEGLEQ